MPERAGLGLQLTGCAIDPEGQVVPESFRKTELSTDNQRITEVRKDLLYHQIQPFSLEMPHP